MTNSLKQGEDIALTGFGQFQITERTARPTRNFRTGKLMNVPASKVVRFKVGKGLKQAVRAN